MSTILTPLSSGLYTAGKGVLHFYPHDGDHKALGAGFRIGDCDAFSVQVEVTENERYSNEFGIKTLALKLLDEVKASISITAVQMSDLMRAAAVMGKKTSLSQTAATAQETTFDEAGIYLLDAYAVTNVNVEKPDASPAAEGGDYKLDAASGQIEVITPGLTVTYDVPSLDGKFATGIASSTGLRGTLIYRGTNAQGVKSLVRIHDVELRPSGARAYITSDANPQPIELSGTAYAVTGEGQDFSIGYETTL